VSDLAHAIWAVSVGVVAVSAWRVAATYFGLLTKRLELDTERHEAVKALTARFAEVQAIANNLKLEWTNSKLVRGK
jgi:NAD/NADP transhydrogenase alpha subunit